MKLSYFVAGTNDMKAATQFYDGLFAQSGIAQIGATDRMTFWQGGEFAFAIALPFDGQAATHGNGTMFGFDAGSTDDVNRLYKLALELGGTCEGKPNRRGPRYSAYVRDLDRNKLCFFK